MLTWPVVLAVLFGALLHASWNVLVKSSTDKALDTALIHLLGSLIALPLLLVVGLPGAASWPHILASVVIHIGYYIALTGAYKHGDMGLTYPLMRGVAPMLVAVSAVMTVGESLAPMAWVGVLWHLRWRTGARAEPTRAGQSSGDAVRAGQRRGHSGLHRD